MIDPDGEYGYDPPLSDSHKHPAIDPLLPEVNNLNIPYIGLAGGILTKLPNHTINCNIDMWPLELVYKLKSEIIQLSTIIDEFDQNLQTESCNQNKKIVENMHVTECEQSLTIPSLHSTSYHQKELRFEPMQRSPSAFPTSSSQNFTHPKRNEFVRSRSPYSHRRNLSSSGKPYTPESLWENTDIFMKPIESISQYQDILRPTQCHSDKFLSVEKPGVHYSVKLPRNPNILSDPMKARLIIPPPIMPQGSSTVPHIKSRLVAAVVPLLGNENPYNFKIDNPEMPYQTSVSNDLQKYENLLTPQVEGDIISAYGNLSFDDRLSIELEYTGLIPIEGVPTDLDCPIISDLNEAILKEESIIQESNHLRYIIAESLQKNKSFIEKRNQRAKIISDLIEKFQQMEKAKQQLEKKKKAISSTESD